MAISCSCCEVTLATKERDDGSHRGGNPSVFSRKSFVCSIRTFASSCSSEVKGRMLTKVRCVEFRVLLGASLTRRLGRSSSIKTLTGMVTSCVATCNNSLFEIFLRSVLTLEIFNSLPSRRVVSWLEKACGRTCLQIILTNTKTLVH